MNRSFSESAARIARTCSDLAAPAVLSVDLAAFDRELTVQALEEMGYFVARVDRFAVSDKRSLLDALDRACGFPDWFGANWDALMDCLVDFFWAPAKGYVLIGPDLMELDATERQIFFEIVQEAAQIWKRAGIPFKLLVPSGKTGRRSSP